jgi:hypothetical protein
MRGSEAPGQHLDLARKFAVHALAVNVRDLQETLDRHRVLPGLDRGGWWLLLQQVLSAGFVTPFTICQRSPPKYSPAGIFAATGADRGGVR